MVKVRPLIIFIASNILTEANEAVTGQETVMARAVHLHFQ
jgi:hypothetical protein